MTSANRTPISVRISQEDADFIAKLELDGAHTPSEKIRELLRQARLAHTQAQDYETLLAQAERLFATAHHDVLYAEKKLGVHSALLARLFELMPDLVAILAADLPKAAQVADLCQYERELMWRVVRLMDSVLQLAVTGRGAAYDDKVMKELDNTLKLASIVQAQASDVVFK